MYRFGSGSGKLRVVVKAKKVNRIAKANVFTEISRFRLMEHRRNTGIHALTGWGKNSTYNTLHSLSLNFTVVSSLWHLPPLSLSFTQLLTLRPIILGNWHAFKRTQTHNHDQSQYININTLKSSSPQLPFRNNQLFQ